MATWRAVIGQFTDASEAYFDAARERLARVLRLGDPVCVAAYRGFGDGHMIHLKGRVLEEPRLRVATDRDSIWDNLVNMYRRFESEEISGARVRARVAGVEQEVVTDSEGYFDLSIAPAGGLPSSAPWQMVEIELLDPRPQSNRPVRETAQVLVPAPTAQFGVISDIDDTVVHTGATSLLRMARTTFLGNARTRLPFEGVAALYRALEQGASADVVNPIFYVSSSPWNLYDMLVEFFELQGIPAGPIFLRDWGVSWSQVGPKRHHGHKLSSIQRLLDFYSDLPFILIGDSGQADPEIYAEVVRAYPNRILAVYIRNITREPERMDAIRALAAEVVAAGSTLMLADDSVAVAEHAVANGWISAERLPEIRGEKEADQAPPSLVERLLGEEAPAEAPAVVVRADNAAETQAALRTGALEAALQTGDEKKEAPPVVIVEGETTPQPGPDAAP